MRLGAPAYPGETLVFSGEVAAVDGDRVEVAVRGVTSLGPHVTGTVVIDVPGPDR